MSDEDLRKLLRERGIELFSDKLLQQYRNKLIICNIPLKKKRMAQIIIPIENNTKDIDLIIGHLRLIKKSLA